MYELLQVWAVANPEVALPFVIASAVGLAALYATWMQ
jgi:hypothetical protein